MKGLIVYSSLTGNTKKFAHRLHEGLSMLMEWDICDLREQPSIEQYDILLLGGWGDRGTLDKSALQAFEKIKTGSQYIGLFLTLGALPQGHYGKRSKENLDKLLEECNGIGCFLLPGTVDKKVMDALEEIPQHVMSKEMKDMMLEIGKNSRAATEDEYNEAIAYFTNIIQKILRRDNE